MKLKIFNNVLMFSIEDKFNEKSILDMMNYYRVSKKNRYLYIQQKRVFINNEVITSLKVNLMKGDTLKIVDFEEKIDYKAATELPKVIYEDDLYLVVHKDSDMIIHSDNKNETNTLAGLVANYYQETGQSHAVRYIHRLDKLTSGLVIFNKIPFFQAYSDFMIENKLINRYYIAYVVGGNFQQKKFDIVKGIARDRHDAKLMRISDKGKEAISHFKVLKNKGKFALVECKLETGRTHQIRLHLASINHSIVNDPLYGKECFEFSEMGLYAYKVEIINPISNDKFEVLDSYFKVDDFFDYSK